MIKQLKRQCLSALFILLAVDLALLHFTTYDTFKSTVR